jgi:hypothetical protein
VTVEQERRVLMLWTAINELAPADENPLRWAVGRTSMPFRKVDWARRIRNKVAHPDGRPLSPRDVTRAGDIFEDLLTRLGGTPPELGAPEPAADGSVRGSGGSSANGSTNGTATAAAGVRRPVFEKRKMPVATIVLLAVGIACTLSLYLALAGLPALVLSSIAMSKVYTDYAGTERLTRTGWRVFVMMLMITLAGLALHWVTTRSLEL